MFSPVMSSRQGLQYQTCIHLYGGCMKLKQRVVVYDSNPPTATVQLANGLRDGVNLKEFEVLFWDLIL